MDLATAEKIHPANAIVTLLDLLIRDLMLMAPIQTPRWLKFRADSLPELRAGRDEARWQRRLLVHAEALMEEAFRGTAKRMAERKGE